MPETMLTALVFLINTLFDLYLFVLIIRIMLAFAGANYFNPITQLIIRLTDFIIKPLRRRIPNYRRIEISTILLLFLIEITKFLLIVGLTAGHFYFIGIVILSFGAALKLLIQTFFYAILFQAILSWVQPLSPVNHLLSQITAPILRPLQRWIPPVAGFDISPIPAMIGLQLLIIILAGPIMTLGLAYAA